ncbi:hypothetical protein ZTR_06048 [Talaromyces verruculosus]|nr:hypothetical protein ZTR_06048 [Talaromyces verruculosus]
MMDLARDLPNAFFTAALLIFLPTVSLILTPKRSLLRYVTIICMIIPSSRFMHIYPGASILRNIGSIQLVLTTVQAINVLLLNPLDEGDIAREIPQKARFRSSRLYHAAEAVIQLRAIGTPRQIKNVPLQPGQISVFVWQYLALDVLQTVARLNPSPTEGFTHVDWFVSMDKWLERTLMNLFNCFGPSRIAIDANYRFLSIIFVGLGFDTAENWPPLFGRMVDVYTIRNFSGKFWHQLLRGPFTAVSNFIARDILNLPRRSLLERYTNVFLVFFASGLLHILVDRIQAIPYEYSGAMIAFPITAFAITFEDGVQELWKRFTSSRKASRNADFVLPLWQRMVGYIWTMAWLLVVSTFYFDPRYQLPGELTTLVPLSLSEKLGLAPVGSVVLGFGLLIAYAFECEV